VTPAPRRRPGLIEVLSAQGGETFHRLLRGRQLELRDFYSARELGRRVPSRTPWVVFVGVSMFDSRKGALTVARRRPAIVAQLALPAGRGINYAKTAEADVLEVVQADPSLAGEFGYLCFDDDGNRVGEFVSGAELLAQGGAAA